MKLLAAETQSVHLHLSSPFKNSMVPRGCYRVLKSKKAGHDCLIRAISGLECLIRALAVLYVPYSVKLIRGQIPRPCILEPRRAASGARIQRSGSGHTPRNVKRFRGGLVVEAYKLLYRSTLGSRVIKKKEKVIHPFEPAKCRGLRHCPANMARITQSRPDYG
jgi:hypothetical protein